VGSGKDDTKTTIKLPILYIFLLYYEGKKRTKSKFFSKMMEK